MLKVHSTILGEFCYAIKTNLENPDEAIPKY